MIKIGELRKLSEEDLLKKKQQLEFEIMSSNAKFSNSKIKPEQRNIRRKTIAQILTILNERKSNLHK